MENLTKEKSNLMQAVAMLAILASVYFIIEIVSSIKEFRYIGSDSVVTNTITLSGYGEVFAVPDIANISFTIKKTAQTAEAAQAEVATVEKSALLFLRAQDIDDKDIKTQNASVYPKYEWQRDPCPQSAGAQAEGLIYPCSTGGKNVLIGYEATESITVKVRAVDNAGEVMQGLGSVGVSNLNGPNFAIDDEDGLKVEARKKAIDDARAKAKTLAKDLDVHLGKVISFNEGGDIGLPFARNEALALDSGSIQASAELPKGENTISSSVTIVYEIR